MKQHPAARTTKLKKITKLVTNNKLYSFLLFAVVVMGLGASLQLFSRAATSLPVVSYEAEVAVKTGPVTVQTSAAASAGSNVKFGPVSPPTTGTTQFGMSSPDDKWNERLAQVGGPQNIKFRRLFYTSLTGSYGKVQEAINANMVPIISFKVSPYSWAQVASGQADNDLRAIVTKMNAIPGKKHLVLHHEPAGDGTAADYVAMQLHALPILKTAQQATVGPIANGWWWSAKSQGYTDAEIAQWLPDSVINLSDVIASDTYQDESLNEDGSIKAKRMADWAKRKGNVRALGIGEFNGWNASSITNVMNVVKAEPLFEWALVWNAGPTGLGTPLEGERLEAFKAGILTQNPTSIGL